jgi:hypothetical protein
MVSSTSVVSQIIDSLYSLSVRSRQTHSSSLTTRRSLSNGEYARDCTNLYRELERIIVKETSIDGLPVVMKGVDRKLNGGVSSQVIIQQHLSHHSTKRGCANFYLLSRPSPQTRNTSWRTAFSRRSRKPLTSAFLSLRTRTKVSLICVMASLQALSKPLSP